MNEKKLQSFNSLYFMSVSFGLAIDNLQFNKLKENQFILSLFHLIRFAF